MSSAGAPYTVHRDDKVVGQNLGLTAAWNLMDLMIQGYPESHVEVRDGSGLRFTYHSPDGRVPSDLWHPYARITWRARPLPLPRRAKA